MRTLLSILFLVCLASNAWAQEEKQFTLGKGRTVWGHLYEILRCTDSQLADIDGKVLGDNGLTEAEAVGLQPDATIVVRRGCDGKLNTAEGSKAFNALKATRDQLMEKYATAEAKITELAGKNAELLDVIVASVPKYWRDAAVIIGGVAIAFFTSTIFFGLRWKSAMKEVSRLTAFVASHVLFPKEVRVPHFGQVYVFKFVQDRGVGRYYYECPSCDERILWHSSCEGHMREHHGDEGRIQFRETRGEFPETTDNFLSEEETEGMRQAV